jgi:hypothetical protein
MGGSMTELLVSIILRGVSLRLKDGELQFGPPQRVTPFMKQQIRLYKDELEFLVESESERIAIQWVEDDVNWNRL